MYRTKRTLDDIKANGYELDFSTVFNKSLDNFKKTALMSGLGMILITIVMAIIFILITFGVVGVSMVNDGKSLFDVQNFGFVELAVYFLAVTLFAVICFPLTAGFIKMAQDAAKGESLGLGTLFSFYGNKYTGTLISAGVIIGGVTNIFSTLLSFVGWNFLGALVSLVISFFTFLTIPLIIFDGKSALESIEGSMQIIAKQLIIILGLWVISIIFCTLGIFGLCIGIFFTLPFLYSFQYTLFAEIVGDPIEIDEFPENQSAEL